MVWDEYLGKLRKVIALRPAGADVCIGLDANIGLGHLAISCPQISEKALPDVDKHVRAVDLLGILLDV